MWFRRDLRLGDHPAILAAAADGAEVVPVFVVDPTFASAGPPRQAFLHDCLAALDASLRTASGTGLVVRHGDPTHVIPALAAELDATSVVVSRDYAPYGRARDAAVADALRVSAASCAASARRTPSTLARSARATATRTPCSPRSRRSGDAPAGTTRFPNPVATSSGPVRAPPASNPTACPTGRTRGATFPMPARRPRSTGGGDSSMSRVRPTARCVPGSTRTTTCVIVRRCAGRVNSLPT